MYETWLYAYVRTSYVNVDCNSYVPTPSTYICNGLLHPSSLHEVWPYNNVHSIEHSFSGMYIVSF